MEKPSAKRRYSRVDWDDAGQVDVVSELGYGLIPMVDADGGGRLLNRIRNSQKLL